MALPLISNGGSDKRRVDCRIDGKDVCAVDENLQERRPPTRDGSMIDDGDKRRRKMMGI